jgi:hypothetical protein
MIKIALGFIGTLVAIILTFVFVGLGVSYILLFLNFSGPQSVVGLCFDIGFICGLICSLSVGFIICRYFWLQYSSSDPE